MSVQNITGYKNYLTKHSYHKNIKVYVISYKKIDIIENWYNDIIVVVTMVIFWESVKTH